MYWNRKLHSLLPSILITQNERKNAEAVILPARPCITRTKLVEESVIFATWGYFSALTLRTLAGSPSSALSSCSSHLPLFKPPEIKARHVLRCLPPEGWNYAWTFFVGLAPRERHSSLHSRVSRLSHIQTPRGTRRSRRLPVPARLMGPAIASSGAKIIIPHRALLERGQPRLASPGFAAVGEKTPPHR